ncbi:hypothetical protein GOODEAATRI_010898 [Goodea atripinnis]|uniref:Serine/threonine-protein phosphatase PGAM5, mitochondrial n=1 Tax=Goodea atripinnis TaxID=208336 RepID=A0ABV0N1U1_9TELE
MSYRKTFKLICSFAGGSAALVFAAVAADSRGYFGEPRGEAASRWSRFGVLHAAQPAWTPATHTPAPTGPGWDFNWDNEWTEPLLGLFVLSLCFISGREQAELTGQRLAALGLKYDVLIHSSMTRATETAHIISKHIPAKVALNLFTVLQQYHEDGARIEAAFRRYIHRADPKQKEDSYEIIVCHANVIRYFVCRALQFPPEGWLRIGLHNGSITWLTIRPSGRVALRTLGDAGFMPPDKLTRT